MKQIIEGLKAFATVPAGLAIMGIPMWILWPLGYPDLGLEISFGLLILLIFLVGCYIVGDSLLRDKERNAK